MEKIDWVRKLTSRKLWVAVSSFVGMLIVAFGASEAVATQVVSIVMAGASMIAYIIGEGFVDAAGAGGEAMRAEFEPVELPEGNEE